MDDVRPPGAAGAGRSRGMLAVLCTAQFVLILDIAVVNVALVPLARDLATAPDTLQLVASVYAAAFGGALLIGGRIADGGRRKQTFLGGLVLFALASALCGAAWSIPVILTGRALQGAGAALASPAALSLLTTTFREGPERDRALGTWASVAAAGGAAGLVAAGALTGLFGWRSVFLINLPIIAVVVVAARRALPVDVAAPDGPRLPIASGTAAAASIVALVAGLGVLEAAGPTPRAVVLLVAAVVLLATHRALDRRAAHPLVPGMLLRSRQILAANAVTALMSTVVLGINFFLAVHLQARLGFGPVATGLAFLPITAVSALTATAAARLVPRLGARTLLVAGMAAMTAGCALLAGLPGDGDYLATVLPGMVLVAAGMGPAFAVGTIAGTAGVAAQQQGAAAALLSSSMQIGAAVGLAVLGVLAAGPTDPPAGTRLAFVAMAITGASALACALALPGRTHLSRTGRSTSPPHLPAHAAGCIPGCARAATTAAASP